MKFFEFLISCQYRKFYAEKVAKYVFMQQIFIKLYIKTELMIIALRFALIHTGEYP